MAPTNLWRRQTSRRDPPRSERSNHSKDLRLRRSSGTCGRTGLPLHIAEFPTATQGAIEIDKSHFPAKVELHQCIFRREKIQLGINDFEVVRQTAVVP